MSSDELFGVALQQETASVERLVRVLSNTWRAMFGQPPASLSEDLEALAPLFGSGVRPATLKTRIFAMPEADQETVTVAGDAGIAIEVLDGCALVTPEGRVLLEVLMEVRGANNPAIGIDRQLWAVTTANSQRVAWHQSWLRKQFDSSVSLPVVGAGLFLLVNGSIGRENALLLPSDNKKDRELGAIVMPPIAVFSKSLGGSEPEADTGLRQHWTFTQLSRLMGRNVGRDRADDGTITWVQRERASQLLDDLAARLSRESSPRRRVAVRSFMENYRDHRGKLAALGLMHEDPTFTRRVLERLGGPDDSL